MRAGLLIAWLAAACAADPGAEPIVVTLGTVGADGSGFLPLAGDQTLVPGAQGGFHVWLKIRLQAMPPGTVTVERSARRVSDGKLVLKTEGAMDIGQPGPEGTWETASPIPNFMCPTPVGVNVDGEAIRYQLVISDELGHVLATGSAEATVHCPDGEQHDFCLKICRG